MNALDLARWQFGITTVYHFIFVPLTISMAFVVAGLQTAWVRTGNPVYLRATKFWGKLFLINFAMGVVTGIVQEFQFGMNWSNYSRFVGDIFGAPLAVEGLLAFFMESTFIGLWIFGWDRLPKRLHLATIWLAATGTVLSAYFILAANSFMQHPVGYKVNPVTGRAELKDFFALLTQDVTLVTVAHTLSAAFVSAGAFVIGISAWHLARKSHVDVFRPSLKLGLVVALVASVLVVFTGDLQGKVMTSRQPMKMASAEALYETAQPAPFSIFTIGSLDGSKEIFSVKVPGLLSFLATGSFNGEVQGINNVQAEYQQKFGPGDYKPNIPVTYWSFRLMMGFGFVVAFLSLVGLWLSRRGRLPGRKWFYTLAVFGLFAPILANSFGWLFTEMGRQPWTVFGLITTPASVSPEVSAGEVLTSMVVFTLLYGALAVVEVALMVKYVKLGPPAADEVDENPYDPDAPADRPLTFAY